MRAVGFFQFAVSFFQIAVSFFQFAVSFSQIAVSFFQIAVSFFQFAMSFFQQPVRLRLLKEMPENWFWTQTMLEVYQVKHENDWFDDSELDKYFDHSIEQYYTYEQVRRRFKSF